MTTTTTIDSPIAVTNLDLDAIKELIPHRDPFLLLDGASNLKPGQGIEATWTVPADLDVFRGHFPDFPVLPGVMLVEHMAQAACVLMNYTQEVAESSNKIPVLAKVENASFNGMVRPEDKLETTVELDREVGQFTIFAVRTLVEGKRVAKCNLVVSTASIS